MNVAYTFNHYYLEPTLISIFSLLQARKDNRPITVYLLVEEDLNREQLSPAFEMAEHFGHRTDEFADTLTPRLGRPRMRRFATV